MPSIPQTMIEGSSQLQCPGSPPLPSPPPASPPVPAPPLAIPPDPVAPPESDPPSEGELPPVRRCPPEPSPSTFVSPPSSSPQAATTIGARDHKNHAARRFITFLLFHAPRSQGSSPVNGRQGFAPLAHREAALCIGNSMSAEAQ